jgi:DNA-directed RNA polymerase specialized sigma24 family protein
MREVLALSLEGLSRAEIADVVGVTENNATVRLSRARRMLQEAMNRT